MTKVAIVGAGITGLASAYFIKTQYPQVEITVYEATNRAGGKVKTVQRDGYTIELGPESYLGRKTIMTEVAKSIGMSDEDIVTNETGQSYIYAHNQLYPIPGGSILGVPTDLKPFMLTKLISFKGKLRALKDLSLKPIAMEDENDISVGHFFRARLGDEMLENLIEPLLSGIYGTDIDQLSLMSTFPNFKALEEKHGSIIKGMQQVKKERQQLAHHNQKGPQGQFKQFKKGLNDFINQLENWLVNQDVNFEYETKVHDLVATQKGYFVELAQEERVFYDGVIVTTPHQSFRDWFSSDPKFDYFYQLQASSVATIVFAFDEKNIKNTYNGTGFVIARTSQTDITACTWTTKKWPHTTPEGKVLIRAYIGKPGDNIVNEKSDEELVAIAKKDLSQMMTFYGEPDFTIVNKMPYASPQYHVGHIGKIKEIQQHIYENYPHLQITGAPFEAVGLPDCIQQAKDVVSKLLPRLV
ncbi:protoporphyrinogen oxidase [Staphylococcus coagulans]|uniref:Coproporphyrinogen III oxidase n=1 Tax=Staphylococcus coagulans TaxID=74706 RepID=A0A9X0TNZ0_9STAP|nr:protoporphyrinogen oxidase [Staphylococcus coagulans]MBA8771474.1 protoporphyrinogen oxidase [Staphylococcus coagulans]MBA8776631.1 protoporphyrinogen oxidase [Staphylococcus coagulans]MBT2831382.1 protoporphyrinogen oxidase [Staphylococcus coagulans]MBT2860877.1 protoporphyrinogen oxidase [Staphylococcus coagulans]MBU3873818.1 protoporphyrinogen oxidase [Staphylococcus coagulans]